MRANSDGTKWCSRCKQTKCTSAFGASKRDTDGLKSWCRDCRRVAEQIRMQDEAVRDKNRAQHRERYLANAETERERNRARYHANKKEHQARHRRERLRARFGITVEQFDAMFAAQNGRCAICSTDDFGKVRPHVDHCHITGIVRGLLCAPCNQGLGNFRDNQDRLRKAIAYLDRFGLFLRPVGEYKLAAKRRRSA
jgi:hypothetical protein